MPDSGTDSTGQAQALAPNCAHQNNTWFHRSDSRTVFIFVHGILSDSDACWSNRKAKTFWPSLLKADPQFEDAAIFLGGYSTGLTSGKFDTKDAATELHTSLRTPDERPSPFEKDRLVFVCHSQGGIVVRRMMCQAEESFDGKQVGLILCCSPSWGSKYAAIFRPLIWLAGNKQGAQLSSSHDTLKDLDKDWQSFLTRKSESLGLKGMCLLETRLRIFGLIPLPVLVSEDSGARYFEWRRIAGVDHSQLVKPDSLQHSSHRALRDFAITNKFLTKVRFKNALGELLEKMIAMRRIYDPTPPNTQQAKARAIEELRTKVAETLRLQDRTYSDLNGLRRLRDAALDASGDWAFYDFNRTEFDALVHALEKVIPNLSQS